LSARSRVRHLVEDRRFQRTITVVILVNAVTLGAGTSPRLVTATGGLLTHLDRLALGIFVVELALKLFAYGWRFFRDPWNCFDAVVVGISLPPATGALSVLRALRVLRILRLISAVPSMRRVVETLIAALPGVSAIVGLLVLVVYVAAVLGTHLFAEAAPQYFGDLGRSLWSLFQVTTGEAWPDIAAAVMEHQPMAWVFFLVFILVSTFVVLNLFLAVVVNAMESVREQEEAARPSAPAATTGDPASVQAELAALRQEIAALRAELARAGTPTTGEDRPPVRDAGPAA
jgi:voltage-gated sodium channel